jgi:hypothetical protein
MFIIERKLKIKLGGNAKKKILKIINCSRTIPLLISNNIYFHL